MNIELNKPLYAHSYFFKKKNNKQPFADVLQNSCSQKFNNIHKKTPVLESLF